jgi:hypothetical protein
MVQNGHNCGAERSGDAIGTSLSLRTVHYLDLIDGLTAQKIQAGVLIDIALANVKDKDKDKDNHN